MVPANNQASTAGCHHQRRRKLSGTAPSNSIAGVVLRSAIRITGGRHHDYLHDCWPTGAQDATHVRIDDTVGDLLAKIGAITGQAPTINATTGAITLHTGTAQDLIGDERFRRLDGDGHLAATTSNARSAAAAAPRAPAW